MEIQYGRQLSIASLKDVNVDLFLLGGNHEKRVLTFYNRVKDFVELNETLIFCYKEDFKLSNAEFNCRVISKQEEIHEILERSLTTHNGDKFTLLVDYSCMTKLWYYSIILFFSKKKLDKQNVRLIFAYTPSKYSAPLIPKPNTEIAPLPGKFSVPTDKPKALIVCLGYEQNKAEGIIEHLDPKVCYLFYTKPALDSMFVKKIESNNKTILNGSEKQIVTYSFNDLLSLERSLNALYQMLKNDYCIIIAPLGPKPFTLVSMIMAAKYDEVDIWRVSSGFDINEYEREPLKGDFFIVNDLYYTNE